MDVDAKRLRKALKSAGVSDRAVDAAWPEWWSDQADTSPSARAELCFAVARKLGLAPKSLINEQVEFVWRDRARFKHGTANSAPERDALSSFGVSVARMLLGMLEGAPVMSRTSEELRRALLTNVPFITLFELLSACWALGIPVVHLRVFPLPTKSMSAMVIRAGGRYAILLGRDSEYPAPIAFTLAHEIGHLMLGHLDEGAAIIDLEDSGARADSADAEEAAADTFAMQLLTGRAMLDFKVEGEQISARALAKAVSDAAPGQRIEPGTLALCYAHNTKEWPIAMASLRHIYSQAKPVWQEVNNIAARQLDWSRLSDDNADYVRALLELAHE